MQMKGSFESLQTLLVYMTNAIIWKVQHAVILAMCRETTSFVYKVQHTREVCPTCIVLFLLPSWCTVYSVHCTLCTVVQYCTHNRCQSLMKDNPAAKDLVKTLHYILSLTTWWKLLIFRLIDPGSVKQHHYICILLHLLCTYRFKS